MIVETHLREEPAQKVMNEMQVAGWTPIMSPAAKAEDNDTGTQGGAMIYHKPWLQTATPAIAEGPQGRILPEGDLAWKHLRIRGLHIILATIYFDHSTGLAGNNLDKFRRAALLTQEGKRMIILAGDYNMEPEEWDQEVLDAVGLTIMTVGAEKTCKTSKGSKQNDYLLVSISLTPFLDDLAIVPDVVWQPHVAIAFSINRRPEKVYHQAINKPATLPYAKEANGKVLPWCIADREWLSKLEEMKNPATKAIDDTKNDDTGIWQHADSLGATESVRTFSIKPRNPKTNEGGAFPPATSGKQ